MVMRHYGSMCMGISIKKLNKAIHKQLDKIAHSTLLGSSNIPSIELAEQLVKLTPDRLQKCFTLIQGVRR